MLKKRSSSKNTNKILYESIIKDVSKTIKKHLNESENDIETLKNNIITLANEYGIDYMDLDDSYLTATINYNEYDDSGRQIDDFPITVDVKSATIDNDDIILSCETSDDEDSDIYFDDDVYIDDLLDNSEKLNILNYINKNI